MTEREWHAAAIALCTQITAELLLDSPSAQFTDSVKEWFKGKIVKHFARYGYDSVESTIWENITQRLRDGKTWYAVGDTVGSVTFTAFGECLPDSLSLSPNVKRDSSPE